MGCGGTTFLAVAFAFSTAAVFSCLQAADSAPAPAAPRAGAPENIQFSRSTSASATIPRPGLRDEKKELLNKSGNVPEGIGPTGPDVSIPSSASLNTAVPNKAMMDKMLKKLDKDRNWLVPGAQELEQEDPFKQLEQQNDPERALTGEKREGVMERFVRGENSKTKTQGPNRLRDLDRDRDRANNRMNRDGKDGSDGKDDKGDERDEVKNENSQSNGLADFDLKRFIRQQDQPNFLNSELPKASQMFRAGNFGNPATMRESSLDRKEREMDAKRSADFMQILKPRTPGFAGTAGVNDPINSPDLTRREMNPVLPQMGDSGAARSPFSGPTPPSSRMQDNNMFGVTGPAASSITPTFTPPVPRPEPGRTRSVVIEPPRRIL